MTTSGALRPTHTATLREAAPGLAALTLATFVGITTEMVPVGLLPPISRTFDVAESTTGLVVTVYAAMVAVLAVPLTVLTRRLPRKGLLLATLVAYTASNVLAALAPTFAVLALGRALGGISHALFFSVSIAYASRLVARDVVGRAMALVTAGVSAGFVLGVPLTTSLGNAVGWRASFGALAVLCVLVTVLVTVLLPPVEAIDAEAQDTVGGRRRVRLAVVASTNTAVFLGHYTVYTYVTVLLLAAGFSDAALGPVLLGFGALGLLALTVTAPMLDRDPRRGALGTIAIMVVGLVALGLVYPSTAWTLAAAAFWCMGFGPVPSVTQAAALRTHAVSADLAGAIVNATSNVGIGAGAALGALVLSRAGAGDLPYVGAAIIGAGLLTIVLARKAFPRTT